MFIQYSSMYILIYIYIYIGIATGRRGFSLRKLPSPRSVLGFRWEMIFKGRPMQMVMEEQASAVETHGVNLPGPWLSAFQWDNQRANLQARCARNLFQISCVLGKQRFISPWRLSCVTLARRSSRGARALRTSSRELVVLPSWISAWGRNKLDRTVRDRGPRFA